MLLLFRPSAGRYLDYLEIGTEIRGTLSEIRPGVGASVEMIQEYVAVLQSRAQPGSGKLFINAAVIGHVGALNTTSGDTGALLINMVNPLFILHGCTKYPFECGCVPGNNSATAGHLRRLGIQVLSLNGCLSHDFLGMSSVKQPLLLEQVVTPRERIPLLLMRRRVPVLTVAALMKQLQVTNVRHLKVDVEGYDDYLMYAFANYMWRHHEFRPLEMSWECIHLPPISQARSMFVFQSYGYRCGRCNNLDCGCFLRTSHSFFSGHGL